MKKFATAGALATAALIPLTLASPAYAVLDRSSITIDCNDQPTSNERDHGILADETLTVTFINCANNDFTILDDLNSGHAVDQSNTVLTNVGSAISSNPYIVEVTEWAALRVQSIDLGYDLDIDITRGTQTEDPEGMLLATSDADIALDAPEFTVADGVVPDDEVQLNNIAGCEIIPGAHVYGMIDITVTQSGNYTFRVVDTSPAEEDLYFNQPVSPIGDNFLALYSEFDPSNIESGLLGCNDDGDDYAVDEWNLANTFADDNNLADGYVETSTGYILDDQFPWFGATLEPGTYTIIAATWDEMSSAMWQAGDNQSGDTWEPTDASVTYEMWGPEGGLTLGHELAETGVNAGFAVWSGIALIGTATAITVGRRRSQRA